MIDDGRDQNENVILKLRRLQIDGFKSLDELDLRVPRDLMFLIGVNGAGKTSLLQALSFVRSFANGKVDEFYNERGWHQMDTRPRIALRTLRSPARGNAIRLMPARNLRVVMHLSCDEAEVVWDFTWSYTPSSAISESIWVKWSDEGQLRQLVNYVRPTKTPPTESGSQIRLEDLRLPGSLLSIVSAERLVEQKDVEILRQIKHWADGIISLELLSPAAMRRGIRGKPKDIGPRGERLASFIAALPLSKREELVKRVSKFYPLATLEAVKKVAGWIDMRILESYSNIARISPIHMSDGFMRILALCAIPEFDDNVSIVLLDEVEDGIEPHILPELIKFISSASSCQFIMTSHSPYLVNFFDLEQVCFMARRGDGQTVVAKADEMDIFQDSKDYFGVGEIWANASLDTVSNAVREAHVRKARVQEPENDEERIAAFLEGQ